MKFWSKFWIVMTYLAYTFSLGLELYLIVTGKGESVANCIWIINCIMIYTALFILIFKFLYSKFDKKGEDDEL